MKKLCYLWTFIMLIVAIAVFGADGKYVLFMFFCAFLIAVYNDWGNLFP